MYEKFLLAHNFKTSKYAGYEKWVVTVLPTGIQVSGVFLASAEVPYLQH
jgi:hypothetical protein